MIRVASELALPGKKPRSALQSGASSVGPFNSVGGTFAAVSCCWHGQLCRLLKGPPLREMHAVAVEGRKPFSCDCQSWRGRSGLKPPLRFRSRTALTLKGRMVRRNLSMEIEGPALHRAAERDTTGSFSPSALHTYVDWGSEAREASQSGNTGLQSLQEP